MARAYLAVPTSRPNELAKILRIAISSSVTISSSIATLKVLRYTINPRLAVCAMTNANRHRYLTVTLAPPHLPEAAKISITSEIIYCHPLFRIYGGQ